MFFMFSTRYLKFYIFFTFYNPGDSNLFVLTVPEPYSKQVGIHYVNIPWTPLMLCFVIRWCYIKTLDPKNKILIKLSFNYVLSFVDYCESFSK